MSPKARLKTRKSTKAMYKPLPLNFVLVLFVDIACLTSRPCLYRKINLLFIKLVVRCRA
jgi:hypothetical protein